MCRNRRELKEKPKRIRVFEVYVSEMSQRRRRGLGHKSGGKAESLTTGWTEEEDFQSIHGAEKRCKVRTPRKTPGLMTLNRRARVERQIGATAEGVRVWENAESHSENYFNKSTKGKERHGTTGGEQRTREGLLLQRTEETEYAPTLMRKIQ